MKPRHAAALALVLAFGCLGAGCTRRPPLSTWHIVEAPRRTCVGPTYQQAIIQVLCGCY